MPVPVVALAGGLTGGGACGGAPSPIDTLGGPCCWGALEDDGCVPVEAGVTVVLIVVVAPVEVPVCDGPVCVEVLGTGCGAGTVDGEGILEPPGAEVVGTELGGGTCDSGGCGGTVC